MNNYWWYLVVTSNGIEVADNSKYYDDAIFCTTFADVSRLVQGYISRDDARPNLVLSVPKSLIPVITSPTKVDSINDLI